MNENDTSVNHEKHSFSKPTIQFAKVRNVKSPERGTEESAGIDFFTPYGMSVEVKPGGSVLIPSGIHVKIPKGWALIAFNKSGIAVNKKLAVGACVVDSDYQGEIHIHLFNHDTTTTYTIGGGTKIVQFILMPIALSNIEYTPIEELYPSESERGTGGFGSTGLN